MNKDPKIHISPELTCLSCSVNFQCQLLLHLERLHCTVSTQTKENPGTRDSKLCKSRTPKLLIYLTDKKYYLFNSLEMSVASFTAMLPFPLIQAPQSSLPIAAQSP